MRLSQGKKTETGLFNSHSVRFCTFVYTQVIRPFLRSASFPLGEPGLRDYAQFKRKMVADYCDDDGTKDGLTNTNPLTWLNDMHVM